LSSRPPGVTVLAVLHIVLAILLLLGALALMAVSMGLPELLPHFRGLAVRSASVGFILLVFVLVEFLLAYGLWNAKGWAWMASLVFAVFGIVFSVLSIFLRPGVGELLSLVVDLLIVYYLMQPSVQNYFGRGAPTRMPQQPSP